MNFLCNTLLYNILFSLFQEQWTTCVYILDGKTDLEVKISDIKLHIPSV